MTTKKTGVLVGIAAIAVIGVAAVLYFSQWPPAQEDATGAIGAAERYRAEQITDEDVILDIPGQEQLAEAVFEVLTDEQKAELIGRTSEAERASFYARFDEADAFARMSPREQGRYVQSLDRAVQERIAKALRFEATEFARMNPDSLGRAVANMDAEARQQAIGRFNADEAFARMSPDQQGRFVQSLDRTVQERIANALRFEATEFARMNPDSLGRAVANMDAETRAKAIGRFDAEEAFARMSADQMGRFVQSLDRAVQERIANSMRFEATDFARINADALGRAVANMDAEARQQAIGRFDAEEAFARMSADQMGRFVQSLDRAVQERFAGALQIKAADLARMNPDALGRAVAKMDAEARQQAIGRFDAEEAFARMSADQMGRFVQSLDRAVQERIANSMRFEATDLARINADSLGRAVANMDAEVRSQAIGRYEMNDAAFERMNTLQRAAFADALGSRALERTVLRSREFNRLSQAQQRAVWANLGRQGQTAALRYAGFEADLARADALQRNNQFERYMQDRFSQN